MTTANAIGMANAGTGNTLNGGAGNDDLYGRHGDDIYIFELGSGHDRILDKTDYYDFTGFDTRATPADMHQSMYVLVDLAVGGMAGAPADGLTAPPEMHVD